MKGAWLQMKGKWEDMNAHWTKNERKMKGKWPLTGIWKEHERTWMHSERKMHVNERKWRKMHANECNTKGIRNIKGIWSVAKATETKKTTARSMSETIWVWILASCWISKLISTKPWKAIGPPKSDNQNNSNYSDVADFDGSTHRCVCLAACLFTIIYPSYCYNMLCGT